MRVLGLDIGSRTIDAVWLDDGAIVDSAIVDTGFDPRQVAESLAARHECERIVATGYGRHAAKELLGASVVTEIKAYALGAHRLFPQAASVLDIGGQDTKVIALGPEGRVLDFEMNDKCAAGTGKFLEVMANALGLGLSQFAEAALGASHAITISGMCTVFAESEVTTLVHRGEDIGQIARGLHESIAKRVVSSLVRVGVQGPLVFAGGVAQNAAMIALLRRDFRGEVWVPDEAQLVGAYGAALSA